MREQPAEGAGQIGLRWLLAYCDDGVVWGRWEPNRGWRLSSEAFPQVSPNVDATNLQELRLFGSDGEVLIWRVPDGFRGRTLRDHVVTTDDPSAPLNETRVLLGDRLIEGPQAGFSLVGDGTGSRHAVPLVCPSRLFQPMRYPLRLDVRHYFALGDDGTVRVVVSRMVDVRVEERP